ncbi:hypothetical protein GCM10020229_36080 [Kitasatospora albolonga]
MTYSNPEVASVGLTEAKAVELYGKDKVVTLKYNLAGNGKSKILKTAGEIKLVQVKDGAVVGVHMVGARMGEQVGEAQLIYNWEALPAEGRPAHPRAPVAVRGPRRGAPGAGGQAAARARLIAPTPAVSPYLYARLDRSR